MTIAIECSALHRGLRAVMLAASTDVERPHLNAVLIESEGDVARLVATNGVWLLKWEFEEGDVGDCPDHFATSIRLEDVRRLLAVLAGGVGRIEVDAREVRFLNGDSLSFFPTDFDPIPWRKVMVGNPGALGATELNPRFLTLAARAFKIGSGSREDISIRFAFCDSSKSPVFLSSPKVPELTGVIMPITPDEPKAEQAAHEVAQ